MDTHILPDKRTNNHILFIFLVLLGIVTLILYWQVGNFPFLNWDDQLYVLENPNVQEGFNFNNLIWAFTGATWQTNYWVPLTWLSFLFDWEMHGLDPGGYHLTNVYLHIANTALLFIALYRLTKAGWQSLFVAALFAIHPLHVESVAWVTERKDTLSAFFWMLSLVAYTYYAEKPGYKRYLFVTICILAGLMSKPMLVTLPFVLLLLDYWPLQRLLKSTADHLAGANGREHFNLSIILEKIPLIILVVIFSIAAFVTQQHEGAIASTANVSIPLRISNTIVSYIAYIGKSFWPFTLSPIYPYPNHIPLWKTAAALISMVSMSVVFFFLRKKSPYLLVGWLWYIGTLLPVIGLIVIGPHGMADRYTYIPHIGLFIMISWAVPQLLGNLRHGGKIIIIAASLVLLVFSAATWRQVQFWQDTGTLFDRALQIDPNNFFAHYVLATLMKKNGNIEKAAAHIDAAIKNRPNYYPALRIKGHILEEQGQYDAAQKYYLEVLHINSLNDEAYNDLGVVSEKLGKQSVAVEYYLKAVEINPNHLKAHNNLAALLVKLQRYAEAELFYQKAIRLAPNSYEIYNDAGKMYSLQGKSDQAIKYLLKALELQPDGAPTINNLGTAYANAGQLDEAINYFEKAVKLEPDNAIFRENLSRAMLLKNSPE